MVSSVIWGLVDSIGGVPGLGRRTYAIGAGSGNRTRVASLENWCTATVLYPQSGRARYPGYLAATYL